MLPLLFIFYKDLVRRMLIVDPFSRASIPEVMSHNWMKYEKRVIDSGSRRPSLSQSANTTCPPSPCLPCDVRMSDNDKQATRKFLSIGSNTDISPICFSDEISSEIPSIALKIGGNGNGNGNVVVLDKDIKNRASRAHSQVEDDLRNPIQLSIQPLIRSQLSTEAANCSVPVMSARSVSSSNSSRTHQTGLRPDALSGSPFSSPKSSPRGSPKGSPHISFKLSVGSPKRQLNTLAINTVNLTVKLDSNDLASLRSSPEKGKTSPGKSPKIRTRRSTYSPKSSPLANSINVMRESFTLLIAF